MVTVVQRAPRSRALPLLLGFALAAVAAVGAPSSQLLSGPDGLGEQALAALVLAAVFAAGLLAPRPGVYALVAVAVLEGAFRKWILNDVAAFLVKDFLALGIYAAVLPRLSRDEWRRPRWLVVPLAAYLVLAVVNLAGSGTWQQAAIGLRSYVIYVPLLWVAPRLLDTRARAVAFALLIAALGVVESVLGTVQALTGNRTLNAFVPGTIPALITHGGVSYLRPTGTFLQVGTLSAFLLFAVLVSLGLVVAGSGRLPLVGLGALVLLTWGFVFASSRALAATTITAVVAAIALLLWRRQWMVAGAVPVAVAVGFLTLAIVPLGGDVRPGRESHFLRNETVTYVDTNGRVVKTKVSVGSGDTSAVGGYVRKATDPTVTDVANGVPTNRITSQLEVIRDQRLWGKGTGTMTLGSEYAVPTAKLHGEGQYTKLAWEQGLVGLAVFLALLLAIGVSALRGVRAATGDARAVALAGLGAAVLLPPWMALIFVFDFPIASLLYYAFAGVTVAASCGAWPASGSGPERA